MPGLYTEILPRGANLGYGQKRGAGGGAPGGSSMVSCEVLHSRGGQGGANAPRPPLNTAMHAIPFVPNSH